MKKAYPYIDFLKMLGLFCIMLAHVNPPQIIMQLRNFDVPFMVILSGMLAANSTPPYHEYLKKRLARLIVPTWIFLCIYFLVAYFITGQFNIKLIIKSFCFQQDSIGYVWIIWVYAIAAMMAIPMMSLYKRFGRRFLVSYLLLYTAYEIHVFFRIGLKSRLLIYTLYYAVPYGLILLMGLIYNSLPKRRRIMIMTGAFLLYTLLAAVLALRKGTYIYTQQFKYPPRIYWISYAVGVSFALLMLGEHFDGCALFDNPVVRFIGRNTLWIYLWHIPFVGLSSRITDMWWLRLLIVIICPVFIDFTQIRCVAIAESVCGIIKPISRFLRG